MPTIRPANAKDIEAITAIYNEAGVGTTASYALEPVTVDDRRAWFDRLAGGNFPVLVFEDGGVVTGYASYGPFRSLGGYANTVEHSVYIASGHRAAGAGRMLMMALIDVARGAGVHVMVGVIDGANTESIAFHERLGFEVTGRLPEVGHKFGQWRDVVFVTRILA
ncbi:N-acetyltransferase [Tessaracoccus sp. HDW20]|uniref:GNAT family N-acetyltransferase n=1 Tax=Tessaracoccus coleopterorum TaxID=2714950 RepID=UPI0018D3AEDE|nr:GNAT family N-acetyltransferase [Tessaracoccus coleopterorum]NHB85541.1 N-acetyltransferase [Tessaracoccus coleopterorum]